MSDQFFDDRDLILAASEQEHTAVPQKSVWQCSRRSVVAAAATALGVFCCAVYVSLRHTDGQTNVRGASILSKEEQVSDAWVDLGLGTVCRNAAGDTSSRPKHGFVRHHLGGMSNCKALCAKTQSCRGVEYDSKHDVCEVWLTQVGAHSHLLLQEPRIALDYACLLKDPECETLKLHRASFAEALHEINEYHAVHCREASDASKCSIDYAKQLDAAAENLCVRAMMACSNSSVCDA
eukprot:TRINITY_DN21715_c0_g1_i1.p1 TRINITY_DN21715_c0_g1~~TRINITY_DN21715_c0_g1_i1.p1  ORF type:complete len:236 (+),score=51.14 TRINITY_DN21715_c0_g1_i1:48-755(+)